MSWRSFLLILLIACSVGMRFVFEANITRTLIRLANHLRTESSLNISKKMIKVTAPGKGVLQTKRLGRVYLISVGRFGNKLFQYAMLLAVRNLTGRPVYYISSMDLRTTFPTMSIPILNATSSRRAKLRLLKGKLEWITGTYLPHFIPSLPVSDVVICCFFQAFKYFYFIRDKVKQEFTFRKEITDHADGVLYKARTSHFGVSTVHSVRFIGIHVRRGDLATTHMYGKGYRVPDVSYFIKAKAYFQKIYSEPILFVVASDDKDWVQQHLNGPDTYISHEESSVIDLALLAACNDTIMSVGTFSWWAGFLAGGKTIYFKDFRTESSRAGRMIRVADRFFTPDWIPMGNWLAELTSQGVIPWGTGSYITVTS